MDENGKTCGQTAMERLCRELMDARPEDLGELEGAALRLFGSIRFDAKGDE